MPTDPYRRKERILCPCSIPLKHYRRKETVQKHLEQDHLRQELEDAVLPEFKHRNFADVPEFEACLESHAAGKQRRRVFGDNIPHDTAGDNPVDSEHYEDRTVLQISDDLEIVDPLHGLGPQAVDDMSEHNVGYEKFADTASSDDDAAAEKDLIEEEDSIGVLWNPATGVYDRHNLDDYASQKQVELGAIDLYAIDTLSLRLDTGGSESQINQHNSIVEKLLKRLDNDGVYKGGLPGHTRTLNLVTQLTGLIHIRFDCCREACCAYTGPYFTYRKCPFCQLDRFKRVQGEDRPIKTFDITSTVRKLRMQYANPGRAKILGRPKRSGNDSLADVWDGAYMTRMKQKGFFSDTRDVALGLSTDGISIHQSGTHSVWPVLLTNFNLPRTERYKRENQMLVGIIPGPKEPKDFNSFFRPIVEELLLLEKGVKAYDAYSKEYFTLKAHLIMLQGDGPGLAKMVGHAGSSAHHFCPRCTQAGVWNGSVRCPQTPPVHIPAQGADRPESCVVNPIRLPMRTHRQWIASAQYMAFTDSSSKAERDRACREHSGVTGFSQFLRLKTIEAPASFVVDGMHILFQTLIPLMFLCWSGNTFSDKERRIANAKTAAKTRKHKTRQGNVQTLGIDNDVMTQPTEADLRVEPVRATSAREQLPGFSNNNKYHVTKQSWSEIAECQLKSRKMIPKAVSESIPPITQHKRYTASMRMHWMLCQSPVLLKGRLDDPFHQAWCKFTRTISSMIEPVDKSQLKSIKRNIARFVMHFETEYYQGEFSRLHLCRSQIHALLHLTDSVEQFGPLDCYWQFAMERTCGQIKRRGKSRSAPDRNLSNATKHLEQLNHISLVCKDTMPQERASFNEDYAYHAIKGQVSLQGVHLLGERVDYALSGTEARELAHSLFRFGFGTLERLKSNVRSQQQCVSRYQRAMCMSNKERTGNFVVKSVSHKETVSDDEKVDKDSDLVLVTANSTALGCDELIVRAQYFLDYDLWGQTLYLMYAKLETFLPEDGLRYLVSTSPAIYQWYRLNAVQEPLGVLVDGERKYVIKARSCFW